MIDFLFRPQKNDWVTLIQCLELLHRNAISMTYTQTEPTADDVPIGKLVVYDNGVNRRIYVRTGLDGVGYTTLTML